MNYSVITECNIDTNLVETVAPPTKETNSSGYNHQMGCGTVTSVMQKKFASGFVLAIIDKDKKVVDYLKDFNEVIKTESLILHKHKTKDHYVIRICPAMEQFILNDAQVIGVSLSDHNLPNDLAGLKKVTKTTRSKIDPTFKNLFKVLKKQGAPAIMKLAAWIDYLKAHPYDADVEEMKLL